MGGEDGLDAVPGLRLVPRDAADEHPVVPGPHATRGVDGLAGAGAAALLEPVTGLADTLTGRGPVFRRVLVTV